MQTLLARLNISGFDVDGYFSSHQSNTSALPNVGIAVSGGGYRACLNGAGAIQAFDSREVNGSSTGHLGGLLQSATYFAGLSGGGWLVGSVYVNNFTTISNLLSNNNDSSVWQFGNSIFEGPAESGIQILNSASYYETITAEVQGKSVDYNTTITDYWGRALSFQLINATDGGPSYTWSSIALEENFSSGDIPMPILVADSRAPGEQLVTGNSTIYEFTPFEFGSFDPTLYGFAPLEYLGTNFSGGVVPDNEQCVRGYDNAGYVMGTSSSLFNQFLLQINTSTFSIPSAFKTVLTALLTSVGEDNDDIASYEPNPFYGFNNQTSEVVQQSSLNIVDGGEDLQNIPLQPLIQPVRNVDIIFAIDSSADTTFNWPNGTSLVATYERSLNGSGIANGTVFPSIPDTNTFVNLGLNTRPTFFGCDPKNVSATKASPLVVYIPNAPYVAYSNVSTFDPSYNNSQRNAIVENGYYVATMANGTTDKQWPTCVGCAILSRSFDRTGTTVPDVCTQCMQTYCWNGTVNSTTPANYDPTVSMSQINITSLGSRATRKLNILTALGIVAAAAVMM